ncbi:hypothetical protein [Mucilaginibacter gotjawali]|uniref:Uncharacterized protein n=1 Tax=Mucilaginibacter gotjawali TaxID=1550579 RepID=A0A839S9Q8_9SPHI|nr:hypothetical protein [Mucilaginibacter gotjawali]MBB3054735.1 hypothetical protein [Mucilaginibacter gotjawali]
MEKINKNQLAIMFIISVVFLPISFNIISQGVEKDQVWRIVMGGLSGSWFLFMAIISGRRIFKKDKDPA